MNQTHSTRSFVTKAGLCFLLVSAVSCQSDETTTDNAPEPETLNQIDSAAPADLIKPEYRIIPAMISVADFSGKVFLLAPDLDTSKGESWGACDCCTDQFLFLDDKRFISVTPCVADNFICKGTYEASESELILHYDASLISRTYDWEMENAGIGTNETRYQTSVESNEESTYTFTAWKCKNSFFIASEEEDIQYGTVDKRTNLKTEIELLKLEGVWDLIEW